MLLILGVAGVCDESPWGRHSDVVRSGHMGYS